MVDSPNNGEWEAVSARPPFDLARLIHPMPVEEFLAEYWEKKPLILRRNDQSYYDGLLTLDDMDRIMSTSSVRASDIRVLSDGTEIPLGQMVGQDQGGQANAVEALFDAYRKGATVNLTFLHERYEPLSRLCRSLAAEFSSGFQTNVYLTPGGKARGLKPHYDTHDVFVVQSYGSKHWYHYAPTVELPLASQPYRRTDDGPGEPIREFDLEAGDLLYMPRGTMHEAVSNAEASLHLTIGVLPVLWSTVLRDALDLLVTRDVRFRTALPLGFAGHEKTRDRTAEMLRELAAEFERTIPVEEVTRRAAKRAWLSRQPMLRGHLMDLESMECVELSTPVCRRPELQWRMTGDARRVRLEFHGKSVALPADFADELRFAAEADTFTGKDIPGPLDDAGRLTLIRTLLREGFLTLR